MTEDPGLRGRASGLTDRRAECGVLDRLINAVRAGESRVLVVRGEPGVGKSALLDHLAGRAAGCRVVRAAGVESEMELAFAGLHQLLAPVLDRADRAAGTAARRAAHRIRSQRQPGTRPVPGRPGRTGPAVGGGRRAAAALRRSKVCQEVVA
jgi:AAA ATPase domain